MELRPASLAGAGLAPALQEICAAYHDQRDSGTGFDPAAPHSGAATGS